jgi:hypothetical protein
MRSVYVVSASRLFCSDCEVAATKLRGDEFVAVNAYGKLTLTLLTQYCPVGQSDIAAK